MPFEWTSAQLIILTLIFFYAASRPGYKHNPRWNKKWLGEIDRVNMDGTFNRCLKSAINATKYDCCPLSQNIPDLPHKKPEVHLSTFRASIMLNFLEFLHLFVENIMTTSSYKMSSGSLQQMIQHLSFIVNVGSSSSSEYLLDILMEEHKNIMVKYFLTPTLERIL